MTDTTVNDDIQLLGPFEVHRDFLFHSQQPDHLNTKVLEKITQQLYEEVLT
jgi:hypothetical protein